MAKPDSNLFKFDKIISIFFTSSLIMEALGPRGLYHQYRRYNDTLHIQLTQVVPRQ